MERGGAGLALQILVPQAKNLISSHKRDLNTKITVILATD